MKTTIAGVALMMALLAGPVAAADDNPFTPFISEHAKRERIVRAEVTLIKQCIRHMWGRDDTEVPIEAWEPMARICVQLVRASREQSERQ